MQNYFLSLSFRVKIADSKILSSVDGATLLLANRTSERHVAEDLPS